MMCPSVVSSQAGASGTASVVAAATVLLGILTNFSSRMSTPTIPMSTAEFTECGETRCGPELECMLNICLCTDSHVPPASDGTCLRFADRDVPEEHDGVVHPHMLLGLIKSTIFKSHSLSDNQTKGFTGKPSTEGSTKAVLPEGVTSSSAGGAKDREVMLNIVTTVMLSALLILSAIIARLLCRHYQKKKILRQGSTFSGHRLLTRMVSTEDSALHGKMSSEEMPPADLKSLVVIQLGRLRLMSRVGRGASTTVYKGWLAAEDVPAGDYKKTAKDTLVAVKRIKDGSTDQDRQDFLYECQIIASLNHVNIVRFYGVVFSGHKDGVPRLVTEFALYGDLATALRKNNPTIRNQGEKYVHIYKEDLLSVCYQVASGMEYLSKAHLIHRNLAAKSCLLTEGLGVKITNFSMPRDVCRSDSYMEKVEGSRQLPVQWMSPECLRHGDFTVSSDVWAFGVLLWEVYTYGSHPYCGLSNTEAIRKICQGVWLERPADCPDPLHDVMLGCWRVDPQHRLTFRQICRTLGTQVKNAELALKPAPPPSPTITSASATSCNVLNEDYLSSEDFFDEDDSTVTWGGDSTSTAHNYRSREGLFSV